MRETERPKAFAIAFLSQPRKMSCPSGQSSCPQGQLIHLHKKWKCADRALVKYWYRKGKGA